MANEHNEHLFYKSLIGHEFGQEGKSKAENRTLLVTVLTFATMIAEIVAGIWTGSMALLADGIHMGGHALALGLAFAAYYLSRRYARDRRLSFGSGKINDLIAYSTSLLLVLTAALIAWESIGRLLGHNEIMAQEAMLVATLGLAINLLSFWILQGGNDDIEEYGEEHDHLGHHGAHRHGAGARARGKASGKNQHAEGPCGACAEGKEKREGESERESEREGEREGERESENAAENVVVLPKQKDRNLNAAIVHVLADAATSVAAIIGIAAAWAWGWTWLDPLIALAASVLIARWGATLLAQTAMVLLDAEAAEQIKATILEKLTGAGDTEVIDLHVWSIGRNAWTMIASVIHHGSLTPQDYKMILESVEGLHHPVIEVQKCDHDPNCGAQCDCRGRKAAELGASASFAAEGAGDPER